VNSDQLKEIINKLPIKLLVTAYLLWTAYDYFHFLGHVERLMGKEPSSVLAMKKKEIEAASSENDKLSAKIKEANEFFKGLEVKRSELRDLAQKLEGMKITLSENIDPAEFMNTIFLESKNTRLSVVQLKPAEANNRENFGEQSFEYQFRGAYVQLLLFLDRIAKLQKIIRVENMSLRPVEAQQGKFTLLSGSLQIKAYRYIGSKADDVAKSVTSGAAPASGGSKPALPGGKPEAGS
jgi:type IV pilus assembly protein PilO